MSIVAVAELDISTAVIPDMVSAREVPFGRAEIHLTFQTATYSCHSLEDDMFACWLFIFS